jgi:tetratricopeptide (TPR) repeat protein
MYAMLGLLFVAVFGVWAVLYARPITEDAQKSPSKLGLRLDKLWDIAHASLREHKYLRAEKALLTILKVDERNSTAYNRLGILYAKQRAFTDAIECFEIAQSLDPNASSLHNVGLIYYETGQYDKAALAFEQALEMEHDVAARHIAYAKVQEKLGHDKKMIESLEEAVKLEPTQQSLKILADTYERTGQQEAADKIRKKLEKSSSPPGTPRQVQQPRRVVM